MRNFNRHEEVVDKIMLEVMMESSKGESQLDDYDGDVEMYKMQEHNLCNMAVSEPKNLRNRGYI